MVYVHLINLLLLGVTETQMQAVSVSKLNLVHYQFRNRDIYLFLWGKSK